MINLESDGITIVKRRHKITRFLQNLFKEAQTTLSTIYLKFAGTVWKLKLPVLSKSWNRTLQNRFAFSSVTLRSVPLDLYAHRIYCVDSRQTDVGR